MKCLALLLALASGAASAQAPPSISLGDLDWWVGLSAGPEAPPMFAGGGIHVSAGRQFAVQLGFEGSDQFTINLAPTTMRAVSLSVGARAQRGRLHAAAFIGPAVVWGRDKFDDDRGGPSRQPYTTSGVAVNGVAFVEVLQGLGLGLGVAGNANSEVSTVGARLTLQAKFN